MGGASAPAPGLEGGEAQGGPSRLRAWQIAAHPPGQAGGAGATVQGPELRGSRGPRRAEAPVWGPRSYLQRFTPGHVPPPSWSDQEFGHKDTSQPCHHHCTEKQENGLKTHSGHCPERAAAKRPTSGCGEPGSGTGPRHSARLAPALLQAPGPRTRLVSSASLPHGRNPPLLALEPSRMSLPTLRHLSPLTLSPFLVSGQAPRRAQDRPGRAPC